MEDLVRIFKVICDNSGRMSPDGPKNTPWQAAQSAIGIYRKFRKEVDDADGGSSD